MPGFGSPFVPLPTPPSISKPDVTSQLMQAVTQFPQQQQEVQQRKLQQQQAKMAMEQQQFTMDETRRKQSLDQLHLLSRIIITDHTGQRPHDPNMIKAVNEAAKAAGLGPMTIIDPTTGQEMIDMQSLNHLINSKLLSDLPSDAVTKVMESQPGDPRAGTAGAYGVERTSIPLETLNAPAWMTPVEKEHERKTFADKMKGLAHGDETVQSVLQWLTSEKSNLVSAGLDPAGLEAQLKDPSFKEEIGRSATAKIQEYESLGIKNINQASYYKMKTETEPANVLSQIQHRTTQDQVAVSRNEWQKNAKATELSQKATELQSKIDLRRVQTQNMLSMINDRSIKQKLGFAKIQAQQAHNTAQEWQREYDALTRQATAYINSGNDVPKELQVQMGKLQSAIQDLEGTASLMDDKIKSEGDNTATLQTGRPATLGYAKGQPVPELSGWSFTGNRLQDGGYEVRGPGGVIKGWRP